MTTPSTATTTPTTPTATGAPAIAEQFRRDGCLAYLVYDPATREAIVIDPRADGVEDLLARIRAASLTLKFAIDTHTHADHISGVAPLARATGAAIVISERTTSQLAALRATDGQSLRVGGLEVKFLATPGHTPDSLVVRVGNMIFTGDTLLVGSTGRTDFIGGSAEELFDSLASKIRPLPDDTILYPGHDYTGRTHSTLAAERATNALFAERDRASFIKRFEGSKQQKPANMDFILKVNREGARPGRGTVGAAELQQKIASREVEAIDVRSPGEFERERIAACTNIPLQQIGKSPSSVPFDRPIVLVCESGTRATMAADLLADHPGCYVLEGGLNAWRREKLPLTGGATGVWAIERQVRLLAGFLVALGVALGFFVHVAFFGLSAFIGLGLMFAAVTNTCGMALALGKMPWNRRRAEAPGVAMGGSCAVGAGPKKGGGCAAG
jgi:glyoxylase-like metal-dependent hydrolase (beta-lactamase superfamily II)